MNKAGKHSLSIVNSVDTGCEESSSHVFTISNSVGPIEFARWVCLWNKTSSSVLVEELVLHCFRVNHTADTNCIHIWRVTVWSVDLWSCFIPSNDFRVCSSIATWFLENVISNSSISGLWLYSDILNSVNFDSSIICKLDKDWVITWLNNFICCINCNNLQIVAVINPEKWDRWCLVFNTYSARRECWWTSSDVYWSYCLVNSSWT